MGGELAHVAIALQGAAVGTPQSIALAVAANGMLLYHAILVGILCLPDLIPPSGVGRDTTVKRSCCR